MAPTLTGFVIMVEPKLRRFVHASGQSGLPTVSAIRPSSSVLHACPALRGILLTSERVVIGCSSRVVFVVADGGIGLAGCKPEGTGSSFV